MKTVSIDSELKTLVSLCNSEPQIQSVLLSKLDDEFFGYAPCKSIFSRLKYLIGKDKPIPNTKLLAEDISLDSECKELLLTKVKPILKEDTANNIIKTLDDYRKLRILSSVMKTAAEELKGNKIKDIDSVIDSAMDSLTKAVVNTSIKFSTQKNNKAVIKEILYGEISLVPSGIKAFDEQNGGFPNGGLVILAADSGGGKSITAMNIAVNQYLMGHSVGFISLEMDEQEMWARIASKLSGVSFEAIFQKKTTNKQKKLVMRKLKEFKEFGDTNDCMFYLLCPEEDLKFSQLEQLIKHKKLDVLYVDYVSLIAPENSNKQEREVLGEIARRAKKLAKRMHIPIVLLSQRNAEGNLKYSGALNEHSNLVIQWFFDEKAATTRELEFDITKARNQKKFKFMVGERYDIMTIVDLGGGSTGPKSLDDVKSPTEEIDFSDSGVQISGFDSEDSI